MQTDVPDVPREILAGLQETVRPAKVTLVAMFAVPVKPLRLVTVTVKLADEPGLKVTLAGLTATVKSRKLTLSMKVDQQLSPNMSQVSVAVVWY